MHGHQYSTLHHHIFQKPKSKVWTARSLRVKINKLLWTDRRPFCSQSQTKSLAKIDDPGKQPFEVKRNVEIDLVVLTENLHDKTTIIPPEMGELQTHQFKCRKMKTSNTDVTKIHGGAELKLHVVPSQRRPFAPQHPSWYSRMPPKTFWMEKMIAGINKCLREYDQVPPTVACHKEEIVVIPELGRASFWTLLSVWLRSPFPLHPRRGGPPGGK